MSWKKVKLGEVIEKVSLKANELDDHSNIPFYGVSNQDGITISKYTSEEKVENYQVIEKGCFAYNPYRINVGSIAVLDKDEKGLISPAYVAFKPKEKKIKAELLLKFLKSREGLRQIKVNARGTVRQALRFEDLCKIEISIPDYEEQKKIVEKLELQSIKLERLNTELSHQLDIVKKLRHQILQDAVQGKLVNQTPDDESASILLKKIKAEKEQLIKEKKLKKDKPLSPIKAEEIPFEIPENWAWCRLGEIVFSMNNGIYKQDKYYNDYGIACLRMYNIQNGKLSFHNIKRMLLTDEEIKTYSLSKGDLLLNRVNSVELLGKTAFVDFLKEPMVYESKNIRVRFIEKEVLPKYINYLFQTEIIKNQILQKFKKVTGQASINQEQLTLLLIPLPPLPEQHRIVAKVESLMRLCDELEASIRQNQSYTEQLLQSALREALQ